MTGLSADIDVSELDEMLRNIPGAEDEIFTGMRRTMSTSLDVLHEQVSGRTPVGATGNLRQSIAPNIYGTAPDLRGELSTVLLYGLAVEQGRPPGLPPPSVEAIEYWVRRKLGIQENAEQVAFFIARAIGKRGTKGAYMFRDGLRAALPTIERLWRQLPGQVSARVEKRLDG